MKSKRLNRSEYTLPNWTDLATELQQLDQKIDRGEEIDGHAPRLMVSTALEPGEYWLFQPGWLNIRWWWEEITVYADITRGSLIKLGAYYVHERTLETMYVNNREFHRTHNFNTHLASVERTTSRLFEEVAHRLFALREKVSWLIYEVISSLFPIYIESWRVGFNTVRRKIENIQSQGEHAATLMAMQEILAKLDDEEIQAFFSFRHGYVHRIRPRPGYEQPLLLLQVEKGLWDSVKRGNLRSRRLVHLAAHTWLRIVMATRTLANVALPPVGVVSHSETAGFSDQFNPWFGLHSEIGIETQHGKLLVSCMKECRGFKAWFIPNEKLQPKGLGSPEDNPVLKTVCETVKRLVPFFEPEKYAGVFKHTILNSDGPQLHLVLLTQDEAATPLAETVIERYGKIPKTDLAERGSLVDRAELERLLPSIEQTRQWPDESRRAFLETITGTNPYHLPIANVRPNGQDIVYHITFRAQCEEDLVIEGTDFAATDYERFVVLGLHHTALNRS